MNLSDEDSGTENNSEKIPLCHQPSNTSLDSPAPNIDANSSSETDTLTQTHHSEKTGNSNSESHRKIDPYLDSDEENINDSKSDSGNVVQYRDSANSDKSDSVKVAPQNNSENDSIKVAPYRDSANSDKSDSKNESEKVASANSDKNDSMNVAQYRKSAKSDKNDSENVAQYRNSANSDKSDSKKVSFKSEKNNSENVAQYRKSDNSEKNDSSNSDKNVSSETFPKRAVSFQFPDETNTKKYEKKHRRAASSQYPTSESYNVIHRLSDNIDSASFVNSAAEIKLAKEYVKSIKFDAHSAKSHNLINNASRSGNVEVTKTLLEAGVSGHCIDLKTGWQPIHIATYHNQIAVVEALSIGESWRFGVPYVYYKGIKCNLLHIASASSSLAVLRYLLSHTIRLGLQIDSTDEGGWSSTHYASSEGHMQALTLLLQAGANVNLSDSNGVTALHIAAYKDRSDIVQYLLSRGANPHIIVKTPHSQSGGSVEIYERVKDIAHFHTGSSLLHWASEKGYENLVAQFKTKGLNINSLNNAGKTPLGLALWGGHVNIINKYFKHTSLSEEDKLWRSLLSEEQGINIINTIQQTDICPIDTCRSDGFTLLHFAAQKGYSNMMQKLLSMKMSANVIDSKGETPLFSAICQNHLACVQSLIRAGADLRMVDKYKNSALHMAAKSSNVSVTDMLLTSSESSRDIDINTCNNFGFTPMYYAMMGSRYDIVQRFLEFSLECGVHPMATNRETLLQYFTERNNLGQYDNAVVRMLECEKILHKSKRDAETCLRAQLGTTEMSSKARDQLQAMYEVTTAQKHCWNFWFVLSFFLMPSVLYYLDMYTDLLLAIEYYHDYKYFSNSSANTNTSHQHCYGINENDTSVMSIFYGITDCQLKINFVLTLFFILFPFILLSMWNLYIHVTQPDILPAFQRLPSLLRLCVYALIFLTPLAPVMVYLENTYAQIKYMNFSARQMQEVDLKSNPGIHHPVQSQRSLRDQVSYDIKHVAQVRVAITNVMEATLESAFQLILQLYIVGTRYNELGTVKDTTLGSILSLSPRGSGTQLAMQVFSVLISLVTLTWSFTSYHRFSKLGGLTILNALPLLFSVFFQVVSRAVACTLFTLALTWRILAVLGTHFIIVLALKLWLEERSLGEYRPEYISETLYWRKWNTWKCLRCLRSYFYVFLGTIASTLIYFRLERPSSAKKLSRRHSTVAIQLLFLCLAFVENFVLVSMGVIYLDKTRYDQTFIIFCCVVCGVSYLTGVILHIVYYSCFGHPWVNINGPIISMDPDTGIPVLAYYTEGTISKRPLPACCCVPDTWYTQIPIHIYQRDIKEIPQERVKLIGESSMSY